MTNQDETKIVNLLERDGVVVNSSDEIANKVYTLRKLSAKDISPMLKILKKIELKKLKSVFIDTDLSELINDLKENKCIDGTETSQEENETAINTDLIVKIGGNLVLEAIPMFLEAFDNCIEDVNKLLASVANMELADLENLDLDVYFRLIYDFITKEEFAGFLKVVSKFLRSEN